jgi:hypothetical protein
MRASTGKSASSYAMRQAHLASHKASENVLTQPVHADNRARHPSYIGQPRVTTSAWSCAAMMQAPSPATRLPR